MIRKNTYYLLVASVITLGVLGSINCGEIVSFFLYGSGRSAHPSDILQLKSFELINQALTEKKQPPPFLFTGLPVSPFRLTGSLYSEKRPVSAASVPVVRLTLRGTLKKETPLAILEDEQGKTYICKRGDTVMNWSVREIQEDRVTLQGSRGKAVLGVVESNKAQGQKK
jgi:hypothetical protein